MRTIPFWLTLATMAILPATVTAQPPAVNPLPAPPPTLLPPTPQPAGYQLPATPEVHDVFRRRTEERGQRPRRGQRHALRRQARPGRPLPIPQGSPPGAAGPGHLLPPQSVEPVIPETKPPPSPPPG
jgi:hypothetical protein